ncbi:HAMP domain-containing sensor histidine kinase [Paenibacillus sp. LHD-117]|uniref:sensor histidine kinase n=1 Tax=Paenibacillus sp. LHD-117 TaxID=3071412 RepID=UPI0027DFD7E5|nr:HAMP domain-containing sensor histidine kinase [Paenibacillus sp. LHD-117]MDQ6423627.1 HAMP domain-containing sensor histidine kinase [Paenibacillus sp. LHD-117]
MIAAFLFIPVILPIASVSYSIVQWISGNDIVDDTKYGGTTAVRTMWHAEAAKMDGLSVDEIDAALLELKRQYPEATMFWVDGEGVTRRQLPPQSDIPAKWTPREAIRFMKASVGSDPYTVVAFLGKDNAGPGFMTLRMPRDILSPGSPIGAGTPYYIAFIFVMFAFFVAMSLLFFRHIRRRLLRLQSAMALQDEHGIPMPIGVRREDEIGALELAFNGMVVQLRDSRKRQAEEEELRKSLIANLSHDLRTPLTIMNGHLHQLQGERLSEHGRQSLSVMQAKSEGLGELIDNLLAYTLMTGGRYRLACEETDVMRLARESAAGWYPVWEREGLEVEVDLPHESMIWSVDRAAFQRMLDNLFQNVVRHAGNGGYIGLTLAERAGRTSLVVADRGNGMKAGSPGSGAGIGLAIVDYLAESMSGKPKAPRRERGFIFTSGPRRQGARNKAGAASERRPGFFLNEI